MSALLVGYARCSTDAQDLTVQRDALATLRVSPEQTYVDHGCGRPREVAIVHTSGTSTRPKTGTGRLPTRSLDWPHRPQ